MKAVVLVSGGMDSTTLLHYVIKELAYSEIYALSYNYGQKHSKELQMAQWQCEQLPAVKDYMSLDIRLVAGLTKGASALTDGDIAVPALENIAQADLDQPLTYVPNRNMIMLSLAAAYAESRGCTEVFYGAQAQDEYGYWDCTKTFVEQINQVLSLNRKNPVQIKAPFTSKSKTEELRMGLDMNIDYSKTWTCYRGGEKACGVCPTRVERLKAFSDLNIKDPLIYED